MPSIEAVGIDNWTILFKTGVFPDRHRPVYIWIHHEEVPFPQLREAILIHDADNNLVWNLTDSKKDLHELLDPCYTVLMWKYQNN